MEETNGCGEIARNILETVKGLDIGILRRHSRAG